MNIKTTLKASVAAGALLALATPMQSAEAGTTASNGKFDVTWGARIHRALRHVDDGQHDGIFQTDGTSANSEVWVSGSGKLTEGITMGGLLRWDIGKNQGTISLVAPRVTRPPPTMHSLRSMKRFTSSISWAR